MFTRLLHAASIGLFILSGSRLHLGVFYFAGVAIAAVLLAYENSLIKAKRFIKTECRFFYDERGHQCNNVLLCGD